MTDFECPGLPADWVNAWLAAVGIAVLDPRIRLRWSSDSTPVAVLSASEVDPIDAVVESWPDASWLEDMPIARDWHQFEPMTRKVPVDLFRERIKMARRHPLSWTLSSTVTDLQTDKHGHIAHGPFDPSGPGTIKWLHHRLMRLHNRVELSAERVRDSLTGRTVREQDSGLGFDHTRLGSQADKTKQWVDPLVEVLAFFGLAILPVRGDGIDERLGRHAAGRERQRGWRTGRDDRGTVRHFTWPAWEQPLDSSGIDALLDAWNPDRKSSWQRLRVHAGWQTIEYKPRSLSGTDPTKAYGAQRL